MPRPGRIALAAVLLSLPLVSQPVSREDFFERAREHFERRRFLNTLDSLRIVLQMSEKLDAREDRLKRDAEVLSAESLRELGRHEEAANMYERSLAHGYRESKVYSFLALYYYQRGLWAAALPHFESYYALDKRDTPVHIRYAAAVGRTGKREAARQILENTEAEAAAHPADHCSLLERQKRLREAMACFVALRQSRPDKVQYYVALYRIATVLHKRAEALENAEYLYYIFGTEARYIWPLAEVRLAQKKFYDARLLLEEIVRIEGENADAARLLANLRLEAGSALDKPYRATAKEMRMLQK